MKETIWYTNPDGRQRLETRAGAVLGYARQGPDGYWLCVDADSQPLEWARDLVVARTILLRSSSRGLWA